MSEKAGAAREVPEDDLFTLIGRLGGYLTDDQSIDVMGLIHSAAQHGGPIVKKVWREEGKNRYVGIKFKNFRAALRVHGNVRTPSYVEYPIYHVRAKRHNDRSWRIEL